MSTNNYAIYCHNLYCQAVNLYNEKKLDEAEDIARTLTSDFSTPKFVQIKAWCLKSYCTNNIQLSRERLAAAMALHGGMDLEDDRVRESLAWTQSLVDELETLARDIEERLAATRAKEEEEKVREGVEKLGIGSPEAGEAAGKKE